MKQYRVTTDLARKDDTERILEINTLEYGTSDVLATYADFAWRRDHNPAGQAIIPVIRDNSGNTVGFIWILPSRIRVKGQNYLTAIGSNLVIHPENRNTFGYTKLIRKFRKVFRDHNIPLHFSFVSKGEYHRLRRRNPRTVAIIPLLIKPLDLKSLLNVYFAKGWQRLIIGQIARLLSPFLFRRRTAACKEITIQTVDRFTQDWDQFQPASRPLAMVIRDRAFLSWRFAQVSGRHYRILVARARNQMLGYAVLRCATIRGVKTGLVMDFQVAAGIWGERVGGCLIAEAETYFYAQGMCLAAGLMVPQAAEYHILRRSGYAYLKHVAPQTFRFALYIHDTREKDLASLSARDWFITLADYESF